MLFDNFRIRTKLNLLVLLIMVCVAVAGLAIAGGVKSELISGRIDELKAITESAKGLASSLQDQVAAGALTRAQAEQSFARQLAVMTYDQGQGYVFAYTNDGVAMAMPDAKLIGTNRLELAHQRARSHPRIARRLAEQQRNRSLLRLSARRRDRRAA